MNATSKVVATMFLTMLAAVTGAGADIHSLERVFTVCDPIHGLYFLPGQDSYILQPVLAPQGDLVQIRVVPKFFFNRYHKDWAEPQTPTVMSSSEYEDILSKISEVKPLGNLLRKGQIGVMGNLRMQFTDEYKDAIVRRAMFRSSSEEQYKVAWFSVRYFHSISGKLQAKEISELDSLCRIKVDGRWYWTRKATYARISSSSNVSVSAAGPIGEENEPQTD